MKLFYSGLYGPLVVRNLRRKFGGALFWRVFYLGHFTLLFSLLKSFVDISLGVPAWSNLLYVALLIYTLLIIPLDLLICLFRDSSGRDYELLLMSSMSTREIVIQRWLVSAYQLIFFIFSITPYLLVHQLINNRNPAELFPFLVTLVGLGLSVSAIFFAIVSVAWNRLENNWSEPGLILVLGTFVGGFVVSFAGPYAPFLHHHYAYGYHAIFRPLVTIFMFYNENVRLTDFFLLLSLCYFFTSSQQQKKGENLWIDRLCFIFLSCFFGLFSQSSYYLVWVYLVGVILPLVIIQTRGQVCAEELRVVPKVVRNVKSLRFLFYDDKLTALKLIVLIHAVVGVSLFFARKEECDSALLLLCVAGAGILLPFWMINQYLPGRRLYAAIKLSYFVWIVLPISVSLVNDVLDEFAILRFLVTRLAVLGWLLTCYLIVKLTLEQKDELLFGAENVGNRKISRS